MRGTLRIGETVKLGYVDQSRDTLDADKTVWQEISGGQDEIDLGRRKMPSRAYCALFNFRGADQQKKVGPALGRRAQPRPSRQDAEGGRQRAAARRADQRSRRRHAARARGRRCSTSPAAPSSSRHDRWFLDRIATHILAFEGDSQVGVVRGQLRRLRGRPQAPPRRRGRPAAPHQVQAADAKLKLGAGGRRSMQPWPLRSRDACQQRVDLPAAVLDDRGEFLALGHRHADAVDDRRR